MTTHRIYLHPDRRKPGQTTMTYNSRLIGSSRHPWHDGSRWLLLHGVAMPHDKLETWRDGQLCKSGSVAVLANTLPPK